MPHIPVPQGVPGILGLFAYRPETAGVLNQLAQTLLRGPSSLTSGERELIAAAVSARNKTEFCRLSHSAVAMELLGDKERVRSVAQQGATAEADPKIQALLKIAEAVTDSPQGVSEALVSQAREAGADDVAIHDTVLIAAAFCMYNRYVDGLATVAPLDEAAYTDVGHMLATVGYKTGAPVGAR